jgi:hypothetical protein
LQRIPDALERVTQKIRSATVDPVAKVLTVAAVALIAGMMVFIAVVFLFIGLFRIFGEFLDMKYIYAIVGGLFLLLGLLLWSRRTNRSEEPQ